MSSQAPPPMPWRRWAALLLVALVMAGTCVVLGLWQLGVARDRGYREAVAEAERAPRAELADVLAPGAGFTAAQTNRKVTARGTWEQGRTLIVTNRRQDARAGYWVVTPLVVSSSKARIAVVRGFVARPAPSDVQGTREAVAEHGVGAPGTVAVEGTLTQGEAPADGAGLPAGQVRAAAPSAFVNLWDGAVYDALLLESGESPLAPPRPGAPESAFIARVPPPETPSGLHWQNATYVAQWWAFGAFCIFMWWKMVREERGRLLRGSGEPEVRARSAPHEEESH